jgi:hypothetical protein
MVAEGWNDQEARGKVEQDSDHKRIDAKFRYVPVEIIKQKRAS